MKILFKFLILVLAISSFALAREDYRTYYSEVDIPAVWKNPKEIKVCIIYDEFKNYIFTRSFKAWDDALGSDLNFKYVNNQAEADIIAKFVNKLDENQAGITKTAYVEQNGKVYLAKAVIQISKNSPIGFRFNDAQLNKITLHEIGHAIGILGHSDNINDIMYFSTASQRLSTISSNDVDTVKKIYGF